MGEGERIQPVGSVKWGHFGACNVDSFVTLYNAPVEGNKWNDVLREQLGSPYLLFQGDRSIIKALDTILPGDNAVPTRGCSGKDFAKHAQKLKINETKKEQKNNKLFPHTPLIFLSPWVEIKKKKRSNKFLMEH